MLPPSIPFFSFQHSCHRVFFHLSTEIQPTSFVSGRSCGKHAKNALANVLKNASNGGTLCTLLLYPGPTPPNLACRIVAFCPSLCRFGRLRDPAPAQWPPPTLSPNKVLGGLLFGTQLDPGSIGRLSNAKWWWWGSPDPTPHPQGGGRTLYSTVLTKSLNVKVRELPLISLHNTHDLVKEFQFYQTDFFYQALNIFVRP